MKKNNLIAVITYCVAIMLIVPMMITTIQPLKINHSIEILSKYECEECEKEYLNGFCSCDGIASYQQAVLINKFNCRAYGLSEEYDGYYAISNAGQLYWFADRVNNQNLEFNKAVLVSDISDNGTKNQDNVITSNGTKVSYWRDWTPFYISKDNISEYLVFDGNGHTISGLFVSVLNNNVGFISTIDNTETESVIKNLGIVNSYFAGKNNVGSFVGSAENILISNSYSLAKVESEVSNVGGLAGSLGRYSKIENSYFAGKISGNENVGGILGFGDANEQSGKAVKISNSYYLYESFQGGSVGKNLDKLEITNVYDKMNSDFESGLVAYSLNKGNNSLIWKQTIEKDAFPNFAGQDVYEVDVFRCNDLINVYRKGYSNVEDVPIIMHDYHLADTQDADFLNQTDGYEYYECLFNENHTKEIEISWISLAKKLAFNTRGGEKITTQYIEELTIVKELPTPVRAGYVFVGWYTHENLTEEKQAPFVIEEDIVLYAKWEECDHSENVNELDCGKDVLCSKCSKILEKPKHNYGDWKVTKEPTFKENGEKQKECLECGHIKTEKVLSVIKTWQLALVIIGSIATISVLSFVMVVLLSKGKNQKQENVKKD